MLFCIFYCFKQFFEVDNLMQLISNLDFDAEDKSFHDGCQQKLIDWEIDPGGIECT